MQESIRFLFLLSNFVIQWQAAPKAVNMCATMLFVCIAFGMGQCMRTVSCLGYSNMYA